VRHDVVKLARDPVALLEHGRQRMLGGRDLGRDRAPGRLLGPVGSTAESEPEAPDDREHRPVEEDLSGRPEFLKGQIRQEQRRGPRRGAEERDSSGAEPRHREDGNRHRQELAEEQDVDRTTHHGQHRPDEQRGETGRQRMTPPLCERETGEHRRSAADRGRSVALSRLERHPDLDQTRTRHRRRQDHVEHER
jgi:hypothetical protein